MRFSVNAAFVRAGRAVLVVLTVALVVAAVVATDSAADVNTGQISTTPALYPAFDPAISDYVVRCSGTTPVQVVVSNSSASDTSTTVSVNGQSPRTGAFTAQVGLTYSQGFTITATQGATSKEYHVRCLPSGFPTWTTQRPGAPQAEYYLTSPSLGSSPTRWAIIYDTNGVPMWWMAPDSSSSRPLDTKLVSDAGRPDVLWTDMQAGNVNVGPAAEEHSLDGSFGRSIHISSPYTLNPHEVQRLGNGDYLVIGGYNKSGVNLGPIGGATSATILDDVVQEVTPAGVARWTWDAYDHVGIDEVDSPWQATARSGFGAHDVFHINSAVTDASGNLLVSLRFTDAVFYVADPGGATNPGKVIWKLGGTASQKDGGAILAVSDAGCSGTCLGGQHYARIYTSPDTSDHNVYVTLHDNGTNRGRSPRAVRYRIDAGAKTATRVEQVADSAVTSASCCGSASKLPGGDWVTSWGANPLVAEYSPGSRVFGITFAGAYAYRVDPILPGVLSRDALRSAMDTRYPPSPSGGEPPGGGGPPASDNQPPTAPRSLVARAVSSSQINLSWTASTDDVGVTGYRVERCLGGFCTNFVQVATPSGTTYGDSGLRAYTRYRYRVRAVDAAGNLSPYSNVAAATTLRR
jgi:Arylsulfotransferase (ASST)/Fibronectin type III domain